MNKPKSSPLSLNTTDFPSILKALGFGVVIAGLTYVSEFVVTVDWGEWAPLIVGTIPPILTAIVRFLKNNQ